MLTVHVVAHTHWDREWYHPFVRFQQRLVALVDDLVDAPPLSDETFLLDGQAIVIEDYLEVRPERAAELSSLLQSGQLEAGPWYVLADELIPSGEAIVRNLLRGRRVLRRMRAAPPPVLYCPDSFGHPAALPIVAAGFGLPLVILWRGYGGRRWPQADVAQWVAADGETVLLYHLPPNGYEFGSALPAEVGAARERWRRMRDELARRTTLGVALVPNGADHHARQTDHREAVRALTAAAAETGDTVVSSSLRAFADALLARARSSEVPQVRGELRDSYGYTWALQGTFASRAAQKRANARAERLLLRDAEPWAALARRTGGPSSRPLLDAAWRTLLHAHPHDTLCGCAIDTVARAMDRRLDDAVAQGIGIRDDAIEALAGHDVVAARSLKDSWKPLVMVRNRTARARGGVAIVEVEQFIADVAVGPGSAPAAAPPPIIPLPPALLATHAQIVARDTRYDRVESPQHYPDNDLVAATRAAIWVDAIPGYGLTALPLGERPRVSGEPRPVRTGPLTLENGLVRVVVSEHGRVSIQQGDQRLDDILIIEDRVDLGDLYTPSIRDVASTARFVGGDATHFGPLYGELRLRWLLLPRSQAAHGGGKPTNLTITIALVAESPLVMLAVTGRNRIRDHRLRVGFRTGLRDADVWADAAFGPVHRIPLDVPDADCVAEIPPATAPLHRYVSVFRGARGVTLISDGLAEYEATPEGELLVTLFRAVGELSRNDLSERPGHAGWPTPTPQAQSLGRFAGRLALLTHGARTPETIHRIELAADDALLPLEGRTLRSALIVPPPVHGVELDGTGLAFSACKESEDGAFVVVRCVNLLDEPVHGAWRFGTALREAFRARLDETLLEAVSVNGSHLEFVAPSRAVVTFLVR